MAGPFDIVGDIAGGVADGVARGVGAVAGMFGIGEAGGNDGGSSDWAAWGHGEIRSMLDHTVDPADISAGAQAWREQSQQDMKIITTLTRELDTIVSAGWRGASADAAVRALGPVNDWAANVTEAADKTAQLMDTSGFYAGQAKVAVPPPVEHDWRESLTSFGVGGPLGFGVDAVLQEHAQREAHAEAVRVMNSVYSAPINENRAAVPVYPQLADPTLRPPEPSPLGAPGVGAGLPGSGAIPDGGSPWSQPSAAGLQAVPAGVGSVEDGRDGSGRLAGPQQSGGTSRVGGPGAGGLGNAVGALPFVPPLGGGSGVGEQERTRRGFPGARPRTGRAGAGAGGGFGPRGSGALASGAGQGGGSVGSGGAGRGGAGPGGGAPGGRGGGLGGVPLGAAGAGRGQGSEDSEHRRPSYLIEMDDVFNDGRKVAPPVIGEDPPEYYR